jgi:uncharacterized surface protein with fasciclin (FAS1) repeats
MKGKINRKYSIPKVKSAHNNVPKNCLKTVPVTPIYQIITAFVISAAFAACSGSKTGEAKEKSNGSANNAGAGQSVVMDDVSQKNVLQIAVGSADHTILVAAVKAASLEDVLANTGPFTVFAPTNAAFDKLPKGTVDDLLKPENKDKLASILEYHVSVGVFQKDMLQDGQMIGQASSQNIKISVKGDKIMVNDKATIVGVVPASNGLVYIIDEVLLPLIN